MSEAYTPCEGKGVTWTAMHTSLILSALYILLPAFISDQGNAEDSTCPPHPVPTNGYSKCSNGLSHRSLCETKCDQGYRIKGPSRMLCWCRTNKCSWTGLKAKCEKTNCEFPDLKSGSLRFADSWKGGFAGLIEFQSVTPQENDYGWSVVVVFDRPLGKKVSLMSWNLDLTATSYDGQTFTFVNPINTKKLSKMIDSENRFSALIVTQNIEGNLPESAFAGLYYRRVKDATCLMAPVMPRIRPLYMEQEHTLISTTTSSESEAKQIKPTGSTEKVGSTASAYVSSNTATTEGTKITKIEVSPSSEESIAKKSTTTSAPTTSTTTITTENAVTLEKDEIYCNAQTSHDCYVADKGWEDQGNHYFGGYFNLDYPQGLSDWRMVVSFEEEISNVQTWSCQALDSSDDGLIWTFGPHPWNTKLNQGRTEIRFIATQAYATVESPQAQIFLCSDSFTEGDAIIRGSGLGMEREKETVIIPSPSRPRHTGSTESSTTESTNTGNRKCSARDPDGKPVLRAPQTKPNAKPNNDDTKYNYNEVLHKSLLFYEAQRSGHLPSDNRIPWRGDSALKDGCDIKTDLKGGWYDAGDYVKFNFPMAYTLTTLAWGGIVFREAYEDASELESMIKTIKWGTEYFIKTHIAKNKLVAQIGHGQTDHNFWGRPEELNMNRPTYVLTEKKPGTDLAAETAAALAASSIFLNDTYPELAKEALTHSKEIFEFADKFRAKYSDSVPDAALYYKSYSGYEDELVWGAVWLYKATNDTKYLSAAEKFYETMRRKSLVALEFAWDDKIAGAQVLLAEITGKADYRKPFSKFLNGLPQRKATPKGLYYIGDWGTNRHAANTAFMLIMGARLRPALPKRKLYLQWAKKQIGLLLGDDGRSYVVGFGKNPPERAHHGASSCPPYPERCDWTTYHSYKPNHYVLYGALVGGPDLKGVYNDNRSNYKESEVACDYNAGFQSAVAGLKYYAMKNRDYAVSNETTPQPTTTVVQLTTLSADNSTTYTETTPITTSPTTSSKTVKDPKACRPKRSRRCVKARRAAKKKSSG